ncbi:polysaccharide deacetylase [Nostoc linckia z16]|nr:polysaccharide deacetylase [Nostoc linckia z16]
MARLPVLMYHNVSPPGGVSSGLTISADRLEEQLQWLHAAGYTSLHLQEIEGRNTLPEKSIIITFDDVTVNQMEHAVPLLERYNMKAVFFIPFKYLGKTDEWNDSTEPIMDAAQLKALPANIELGYHSYAHRRYVTLSEEEVNTDFERCRAVIAETGLNVFEAVAYPYGNFPKKGNANREFRQWLQNNGMKMGLRIGNRVNSFPFKDEYTIQRIDVKGQYSLGSFKWRVRFGRLKLF